MLKCRTNSCNFFKSYQISATKSSLNNFYLNSKKFVSTINQNEKAKTNENIFTYLNERNLISCISNPELLTNKETLNQFFKEDPKLYIGFDPTAESLHLGNLIGILTSLRFAAFGINPVFLIGGATGLIGDPSGKNKERPLLNKDKVGKNLNLIENDLVNLMEQIENYSDFKVFMKNKSQFRINNNSKQKSNKSSSGSDEEEKIIEKKLKKISDKPIFTEDQAPNVFENNKDKKSLYDPVNIDDFLKTLELSKKDEMEQSTILTYKIVNNLDFYKELNIIDFLREAGTNLRMGPLLSRETVKNRLSTKEGLSLTEFMYQTFQGYDFLKLYEKYNVRIQIGGSDQWGNMLSGYEIVKKMKNAEVLNMTFPLMTTSNGQKFGKSEGNALFINPKMTPINCIFQYFYNISDADLPKMLNTFTFMEKEEINDVVSYHSKCPEKRCGQKLLAEKITSMLFSQEEANKCVNHTQAHHFKMNTDCTNIDEVLKECHVTELTEECIQNLNVSTLCVNQKIFPTKAQCKRLIQSGSLLINNNKINEDIQINKEMFLNGRYLVLKTGKKHTHIFQIKSKEAHI